MKKYFAFIILLVPSLARGLSQDLPTPRQICRQNLQKMMDVVDHFDHVLGTSPHILPELKDVSLYFSPVDALTCPLDKHPIVIEGIKSSYLRFDKFAQAAQAKVYPSRIPLYFDREAFEGQGRFVLYADRSLRWISENQFMEQQRYLQEQMTLQQSGGWKSYGKRLKVKADTGDLLSTVALAEYFERGLGAKSDLAQAKAWYKKAAEQDDLHSQVALGVLQIRSGQTEKACEWFQRAALKASREGEFNLGVCYETGTLGRSGVNQARIWYEKAARRGYAPAAYNLGVLWANGVGGEQNLSESFKWMMVARQLGHLAAREGEIKIRQDLDQGDEYLARIEASMLVEALWAEDLKNSPPR